jgi:hypothetical protein
MIRRSLQHLETEFILIYTKIPSQKMGRIITELWKSKSPPAIVLALIQVRGLAVAITNKPEKIHSNVTNLPTGNLGIPPTARETDSATAKARIWNGPGRLRRRTTQESGASLERRSRRNLKKRRRRKQEQEQLAGAEIVPSPAPGGP